MKKGIKKDKQNANTVGAGPVSAQITQSQNGITLISLIITIIILLILAGVTININLGENGLFNTAKEAAKSYNIASIKEQIQTEILAKQAENGGKISNESIEKILLKYGKLSNEEKLIDKTLTTNEGNYEIKVSELFNGTAIKDENQEPPVPEEPNEPTIPEEPKEPTFTTVANAPDTSGFNKEKTFYVAWNLNESKTEYIPNAVNMKEVENKNKTIPSNWYDYTEGKNQWANIKTTGGGNDCYWVWIPRYAYQVPNRSSTAQTINIKFLKDDSNIPIGETESITNKTPTPGKWVVHPAFWWDKDNDGVEDQGEQLTGIWVAKFEASSNSTEVVENPTADDLKTNGGGNTSTLQIRVKPNVTSWREITVGNIYKVCQNLKEPNNSLCGTNNTKNTNIDPHMMKNTEWGACVYLSRSVYGKNEEVWNNPYYNNTTNYEPITGLCGKGATDKNLATTDIAKTCKYNQIGGGNASTTGNVYGVYDLAGGAFEYVAGILSSYKSNSSNYDFSNSTTYPNRYFDWYAGNDTDKNTNYNANNEKYGDAVYETSNSGSSDNGSWDASYSNFPDSNYPVFLRGGHAFYGSNSGVFGFFYYTGEINILSSFRPVVVSIQP